MTLGPRFRPEPGVGRDGPTPSPVPPLPFLNLHFMFPLKEGFYCFKNSTKPVVLEQPPMRSALHRNTAEAQRPRPPRRTLHASGSSAVPGTVVLPPRGPGRAVWPACNALSPAGSLPSGLCSQVAFPVRIFLVTQLKNFIHPPAPPTP